MNSSTVTRDKMRTMVVIMICTITTRRAYRYSKERQNVTTIYVLILPFTQLKIFALAAKPPPSRQYHFMAVRANKLQVYNDEVLLNRRDGLPQLMKGRGETSTTKKSVNRTIIANEKQSLPQLQHIRYVTLEISKPSRSMKESSVETSAIQGTRLHDYACSVYILLQICLSCNSIVIMKIRSP